MYAAGYYQHHRQWRRRENKMGTPAKVDKAEVPEAVRQRVGEFLRQSREGRATADDCVRFFDSVKHELTPAGYSWVIKRLVGITGRSDYLTPISPRARAQQTLVHWLNRRWGVNGPAKDVSPADHELLRRYLDVSRDELAGLGAPPLVRALADQVVLAAAEVNGLTARTLAADETWDTASADHYDRRRDRAVRRLLQSVKALHMIRQQAGPAVQLTVNQCVAVAAPAPSGGRDVTPGPE
jgi:hypothetical protein